MCPVSNICSYFQENEIQKLYLAISRKMTTLDEVTTLGIHLGINHDDVNYNVNKYDVRNAAYRFLCWAEENYSLVEKWQKIIEAMTTLEKNQAILEFGLVEKLEAAKHGVKR